MEPRIYRAHLFQSGHQQPVEVNVFDNTLCGVPSWYSNGDGMFFGVLEGAFTEGKTFLQVTGDVSQQMNECIMSTGAKWADSSTIHISSVYYDKQQILEYPLNCFIEIRVYQ